MPFGGNDWLALTQEPTLEPAIPICDAHHHFWDFLTPRMPYQRYLLPELAADISSGHNVRSTVFVEARSMYRAEVYTISKDPAPTNRMDLLLVSPSTRWTSLTPASLTDGAFSPMSVSSLTLRPALSA